MKKGIIIFALGHENYYRMAEALAASLYVNGATPENGISICLIHDDRDKVVYPQLFNDLLILDSKDFRVNGKVVFNNAMVKAYELSPYDITMKLDADMIWIQGRSVLELFLKLQNTDIAFSNRGHGWQKGNSVWVEEEDLKAAYNFNEEHKLYKIFGEFLYFKKCASVKAFFKKVQQVYNKPKVRCADFANGTMTDELAFQIACMMTGTYPHEDNFTPIYNRFLHYRHLERKYPYQLDGFYGYSIGGNMNNQFTKNNYNILARHYFNTLGLLNPYQVADKRAFLPERKKI